MTTDTRNRSMKQFSNNRKISQFRLIQSLLLFELDSDFINGCETEEEA